MQQIRLNTIDNTYFYSARKLYEEAFPVYERRALKSQSKLLANPDYKFDVFVKDNMLIGFILWWNYKEFQYIDHFAVTKTKRNNGYGTKILKEFIKNTSWAHIDIAGPSFVDKPLRVYEKKGGSGYGVRTMLEFIRGL